MLMRPLKLLLVQHTACWVLKERIRRGAQLRPLGTHQEDVVMRPTTGLQFTSTMNDISGPTTSIKAIYTNSQPCQ